MTDNADIAALISSIGSVAGAVLAWISGYQLLVAVFSAFLVALLTFQFNSRMQTRAWKRDIAIKRTSELYGPLYSDFLGIIRIFSRNQSPGDTIYGSYKSTLWSDIVGDYRYRVLAEDLRKQLDEFYELVGRTSLQREALVKLCEKIVFVQTSRESEFKITVLNWGVRFKKIGLPAQAQAFHPSVALAWGESIMTYVRRSFPGADSYRFFLHIEHEGKTGELTEVPLDNAKVEQIFARMENEVNESGVAKEYSKNAQEILSEARALRERIGLIVEQPWKS